MKISMLVNDTGSARFRGSNLPVKFLVSSTLRNFWEGEILVFRQSNVPLYKVERKNVVEKIASMPLQEERTSDVHALVEASKREFLFQLASQIDQEDGERWLLIVDAATLFQRNIEHLFPASGTDAVKQKTRGGDLLWAPCVGDAGRGTEGASVGFFAVRARCLEPFLSLWKKLHKKNNHSFSASEILLQAIRKSGLNSKKFESGEVLEVNAEAMNWPEMQRAAVLTFPGWEHQDQVALIQSLYFGLFYGDQSGVMVNIMEG